MGKAKRGKSYRPQAEPPGHAWAYMRSCGALSADGVPCGRPAALTPVAGEARPRCAAHGGRDDPASVPKRRRPGCESITLPGSNSA